MQSNDRHQRFDPEFDPPPLPSTGRDGAFVRSQTHLIANPFPTFLGWIIAGSALKAGLVKRNLMLSISALIGLLVASVFIQYHCLDCGRTGWIFRARRHVCPLGAARGSMGGTRRWAGPALSTQIKIWLAIAIFAACYYLLNAAGNR